MTTEYASGMKRHYHPGPEDSDGNPTGQFTWYDPNSPNTLLRQGVGEDMSIEPRSYGDWMLQDMLNEFELNGGYMSEKFPIEVWRDAMILAHIYQSETERARWTCQSSWIGGSLWAYSPSRGKKDGHVFAVLNADTQTMRITGNKKSIEFSWTNTGKEKT